MWSARFKMLFYRFGLGTVDAAGLVKQFDLTRTKLRDLAPAVLVASL